MDKFTISKNVQVSPDGYFSKALSSDFDRHVKKSIPFYNDFILKMSNLSNFFVHNRSCVHDLGCSTGTLLQMMQKVNKNKKDVKYIGIDNSNEMVKVARKNTKGIKNIKIINSDILQYDFETSDLIISSLTTHFIQPHLRLPLLDKIYKSLNPKGAFIMLEKVNFTNATIQSLVGDLYYDFKKSKKLTDREILEKNRSLRGVLDPFDDGENFQLLNSAGFKKVELLMKIDFFELTLAIK